MDLLANKENALKPLLSKPFEDLTIHYRFLKPEDSKAVIDLEEEASQGRFKIPFLRVGTIHRQPFGEKMKVFKDGFVLVAEAEVKGVMDICACICVGIKDIFFQGRIVKAGVIFDLRVSERY